MKHRRGFTLLELLIVLFIISILAAMIFPVFSRARESARKVTCLSSIVQLGSALQLYAADWSGAFPPKDNDWSPLDPYVKNRDAFRCPDDASLRPSASPPDEEHQPVQIKSSYIYRSGLANDGLSREIVAFDRWIWHLGGRNVLYLDAHGSWVNALQFWPTAPERVLALDPVFHALTPEQQKAAREGRQIPGELPWK
jgi:prepilin-type N-terminal cleavage/methylation domain-containing protein/prepilin-type processing-associated H-X9-DG protein